MGILVFLSYATKDAGTFQIPLIAEALTNKPEIDDVLYWQEDTHDDIYAYMDKNIGKCDVFIFFSSPHSLKSIPCQKEWHAADALNKPIIPVFTTKEYIPPLLSSRLGVSVDIFNIQENIKLLYELILKKYVPKENQFIFFNFSYINNKEEYQVEKSKPFIDTLIKFSKKYNISVKNFTLSIPSTDASNGNKIFGVLSSDLDENNSYIFSKYGNEFNISIEKTQIITNFKICIIGDDGVGKSQLLQNCIEGGGFEEQYKPTIGTDYWIKQFNFQSQEKIIDITLLFWDFGRFEHFNDIKEQEAFDNTDGIFIVCDVTRRESFERVKLFWMPELQKYLDKDVPVILLANKSDLKPEIDENEIKEILDTTGIHKIFYTSAKDGKNVEKAFKSILPPIIERELKIL